MWETIQSWLLDRLPWHDPYTPPHEPRTLGCQLDSLTMSTTTRAADPIPLEVTPSLHSPAPQLLQMMTVYMTAAPTTKMGVSSVTSVLSCVQKTSSWSTYPGLTARSGTPPVHLLLSNSPQLVQQGFLPTTSKKIKSSGVDFLTVGWFWKGPPTGPWWPCPPVR